MILGIGCDTILFRFMHFPVVGSMTELYLNMVLFVLAEQCLAIFFIGLLPTLRDAISVAHVSAL